MHIRLGWIFGLVLLLASGCLGDGKQSDDDDDNTTPTPTPPPTAERTYMEFGTSNGGSQNDQVTVVVEDMAAPGTGNTYVGWLVSDDESAYLNVGNHDASGGILIINYTDAGGTDLLATYSRGMVTEEDAAAADGLTEPTGAAVMEGWIEGDRLTYGRQLLVSWPDHPDGSTACAHGFNALGTVAEDHVHEAEDELTMNMDLAATQDRAELVYNALSGEYATMDLDGDANVETATDDDGFGFLANDDGGSNAHDGYAAACQDVVDLALANEPSDSPAHEPMADLDTCVSDIGTAAQNALDAGVEISNAGDAAAADTPMGTMHNETDVAKGLAESCFVDAGYEMMRIQLFAL